MFNLYDFVVSIKADASQANAAIATSGNNVSGLASKFGVAKFAGVAAFGALGVAAGKFVADSVQVGMEFDKSMSQVAATMGITTQQMENQKVTTDQFSGSLRDLAIEMGSKTAFTATQASEALNYMALAGYDAKTSAEMLPKVLNLAAAGNMELAKASDLVTDTQTALGLSIEETNTMVDEMARASSKSNTSVEQLGEAMLRVGGTAKNMKGGTTEIATALGLLADNGTKSAEGGTALRNILLGIQSAKFEKTFGALGVSAYDANGNLRPLEATFLDMQKAMDGMTQQERNEIITKTFNKADLKNVNALLGTSKERWDSLQASIKDSKGAAQEMADTQLDNLAGDVTLFQSAMEGLQITISDKVSPKLREFVQIATKGLGDIQDGIKSDGLMGGMVALGDTIGNLAQQLIVSIGDIIVSFATNWSAHYGELLNTGINVIQKIVEGLFTALPKIIEAVPVILQNFITSITTNLPTILNSGVKLLETLIDGIIKTLPKIIEAIPKIIQTLVKGIVDNLPKIIAAGIKLIIALAKGLIQAIPQLVRMAPRIVKALASAVISLVGQLIRAGARLVVGLASGIWSKVQTAVGKIKDVVGGIKDAAVEKIEAFLDVGKNIVEGIWDGISDGYEWIKGKIKDWIGNVKDFFKKLFGIKSPSKWARDEIGWNIAKGMALGIADGQGEVEDAMDGLMPDYDMETSVVSGGLNEALTLSVAGALETAMNGLTPALQQGMVDALEGVKVKLNGRNFGRLTREAVDGAI